MRTDRRHNLAGRRRKEDVPRPRPRYLEIKSTLMAEIRDGRYPVGAKFPNEHELCARFGVSRFTIRQALQGLQNAGIVERWPGVGTMVISTEPREAFVQSLTSMTELLQYPAETYRKDLTIEHIRATSEQAHMLRCRPGDEWVRVRGVRLTRTSQLPISWSDIFIVPRFGGVLDHPNPKGLPVYRQIEDLYDHQIRHARVEIFAGRITDDLAEPMQIEPGTPALNIIRRYTGMDGRIFLVTYTVHPENRFVFTMDLERRWEPTL